MRVPSEKAWDRAFLPIDLLGIALVTSPTYMETGEREFRIGMGIIGGYLAVWSILGIIFARHRPQHDPGQAVREMEAKGLLVSEDYRAVRAFEVGEYEDLGPNYFIELEGGSLLFLSGQYLFEYEPTDDEPEFSQPRRFPCTDFAIRRERKWGNAVEIVCRGVVLEPEVVAPPPTEREFRDGHLPEDGQVIRDRTYQELKKERLTAAQKL